MKRKYLISVLAVFGVSIALYFFLSRPQKLASLPPIARIGKVIPPHSEPVDKCTHDLLALAKLNAKDLTAAYLDRSRSEFACLGADELKKIKTSREIVEAECKWRSKGSKCATARVILQSIVTDRLTRNRDLRGLAKPLLIQKFFSLSSDPSLDAQKRLLDVLDELLARGENPELQPMRLSTLEKLGDKIPSYKTLYHSELIRLEKTEPEISLGARAQSLLDWKDLEGTEARFTAFIDKHPDFAPAYNYRAFFRHKLGLRETSLQDMAKTVELEPNDSFYRDRLAQLKSNPAGFQLSYKTSVSFTMPDIDENVYSKL